MIIILSTTMLRDNKEFRYDTTEDDIDDLQESIAEWVNELHPSTIAAATIKIDVEDCSGEAYDLHQRFINLMPSYEIQSCEHLFSICRILQYIEEEAGTQNMAKMLYILGENSLPEDPDDLIGDEETVAFSSKAAMAEAYYEDTCPSVLAEYINWETIADDLVDFTTIELKGETYYFQS